MQPDHSTEISALEVKIHRHKKLFDQSIENDEILEKTKVIFHDLKMLTEKLDELKKAAPVKKEP